VVPYLASAAPTLQSLPETPELSSVASKGVERVSLHSAWRSGGLADEGERSLRSTAWSANLPGQPVEASDSETLEEKDTEDHAECHWRKSFKLSSAREQVRVEWSGLLGGSRLEGLARFLGCSKCWRWVQRSVARTTREPLYRRLHSEPVETAVCAIILAQSAVVGFGAQEAYDAQFNGAAPKVWVDYFEVGFCIFFTVEILVRLVFEKLAFIFGPDWKWNLFDMVLVLFTLTDLVRVGVRSGDFASAYIGRILRLSRFFALMRLSRVMKLLPSLRIILLSILDSMIALLWCFLFVGFMMYIFAVLVLYGVSEHFRQDTYLDQKMEAELQQWWGGIYRSIVTLFMSISGGCDWADAVSPLRSLGVTYELLFLLYIFLMSFGVLNILMGAFVATAQQIAASDPDTAAKYAHTQVESYIHRIKGFFKQADVDHTGTLSWNEFRRQLLKPKVQRYFRALDLDVSQAHVLFDLLDTDGSGSVSVAEFVDGCVRLRGQARSIDMNRMMCMCERAFYRLNRVVEAFSEQLSMPGKTPQEPVAETADPNSARPILG